MISEISLGEAISPYADFPQMVWVTNDGDTHFNTMARTFFGDTPGDISSYLHPYDIHSFSQRMSHSRSSRSKWEFSCRLRAKDGSFRWHHLICSPLAKGWLFTAQDIDELKMVEEAQKFLVDSTIILSSPLQLQARLNSVAQLVVKHFGGWCTVHLKDGAIINQVGIAHFDPDKKQQAMELARRFPLVVKQEKLKVRSLSKEDATLITLAGEEEISELAETSEHHNLLSSLGLRSFISVPLKNARDVFGAITIVSTDILFSERDLQVTSDLAKMIALYLDNSRLFTEYENQQQRLEKALEGRDIFLSICSHELKTPVTSLKLLTQLTMRQMDKDQFVIDKVNFQKTMKKFYTQVDRLAHLIEEMLDISRIESGKFLLRRESFNVSELMFNIAEACGLHFQELQIPFHSSFEEDVNIVGDQVRIEQVVLNILNNAIKYGNMKDVHLRLYKSEEAAVIEVKDQGLGISHENIERIFKRFERVHADGNITGLGLGLYISRNIIEAHQGRIKVESELGAGSTFSVYLPLKSET